MRKVGFLAALLALSACSQKVITEEQLQANAQGTLDAFKIVCRDGVEYLVSPWHSYAVSPHLKPDGKPYTCEVKK